MVQDSACLKTEGTRAARANSTILKYAAGVRGCEPLARCNRGDRR